MISDIFPHRFNNHYQPGKQLEENDFVLHFKGNSLLLKTDGDQLQIPRKKDFSEIKAEAFFLFTLDEKACFLVNGELGINNKSLDYRDIGFFRTIKQQDIAWGSIVGLHLWNWYSEHRFCGKCGARMQHKIDERAMQCPECGALYFPKISPAIIVAITCNDKLLLARNANFPEGWYALIAGYVDVGETLEETVKREVKEEVGLEIKNIRYYTSQPWPLSGSMMVGFVAEADEHQSICIDNNEIVDAAWFSRGNLPNHPNNLSISGELIEKFEKGELQVFQENI